MTPTPVRWLFAVVEFLDGPTLSTDIVPRCWLAHGKDECYWPSKNLNSNAFDKLVINMQEPEDDWKLYPITILSKTGTVCCM